MSDLSPTAAAYIRTINAGDAPAFHALFAEHAVVNDAGRQFDGAAAIRSWADQDIFAARVTLELLKVAHRGNDTLLTTKVDGDFDRTGLPDPLIIEHQITVENDKIVGLTCRLG